MFSGDLGELTHECRITLPQLQDTKSSRGDEFLNLQQQFYLGSMNHVKASNKVINTAACDFSSANKKDKNKVRKCRS